MPTGTSRPLRRARRTALAASLTACLLTVGAITPEALAETDRTHLVSWDRAGGPSDNGSDDPTISGDGRLVAFSSNATDLVDGDTNGRIDVFVADWRSGDTSLVTRDWQGGPTDGNAERPVISGDGRVIAYDSVATDLVADDTNWRRDVFVFDQRSGTTSLISRGTHGRPANDHAGGPAISADGRFIAYASRASDLVAGDHNDHGDVFVFDRQTGTTELVSRSMTGQPGNRGSGDPSISADGRYVAFSSYATDLVPGSTGRLQIYLRDRAAGTTRLVSRNLSGGGGNDNSAVPVISADGRLVAFHSGASDLVADDTNGQTDVFLHDVASGETTLASRDLSGGPANSSSWDPAISGDGRFVAFRSFASDLVDDDHNGFIDVFLYDRVSDRTLLVSRNAGGQAGNRGSEYPAISSSGRFVTFRSDADDLVAGDRNETRDVFVRDLGPCPGSTDCDQDGLHNDDEEARGTDPFDPDSDGDGASDGAEVHEHGTDPLVADTDGDRYQDGDEIDCGSDPNDPLDIPTPTCALPDLPIPLGGVG